jgi:Fe2+ transport system protein B
MPVRIRKSFNLFPGVKVNMSKGGMSITVGRKGFHLNFSKRGVRQTVGLPGSGISESSYIFKNKEDEEKKEAEKEERSSEEVEEKPKRQRTRRTVRERVSSPWGFFVFVFIALFFIYFGANAFGLLPPNLITNFLHTLTEWAQQVGL